MLPRSLPFLLSTLVACSTRSSNDQGRRAGEGPVVFAEASAAQAPEEPAAPEAPPDLPSELDAESVAPKPEAPPSWEAPKADTGTLPRWVVHQSVSRDTIDALAIRYGVPASKLRKWNRMSEHGQLHPRTPKDLKVRAKRLPPPREHVVHEIVNGDTWGSVSRRYGVLGERVRAWNKHEVGATLEPGEQLNLWFEPLVYGSIIEDQPADTRAAQVPPGGHGIGTPHAGRLVNPVQLPEGAGYEVLYPNSAWGTTFAMRQLVATLDEFHETSDYKGALFVGTISRMRGGSIGGHISHQTGRDVDIRLLVREGLRGPLPARGKRVDWGATWELILALARSGVVQVILLDYGAQRRLYRKAKSEGADQELLAEIIQYPRGWQSSRGLVRHSDGHEGHIHVRYACGPHEPECGD